MGVRWMTKERFFAKAVGEGDCLIWQGKGRIGPYGVAGYGGERWLAHRLAFHLSKGPIDPDAVIRHTCDTPLCVNPDHLLSGTTQDNVDDKVSRKRHCFAEGHHNARLTAALVQEIRARHAAGGVMQKDLAVEYEISRAQMSKIIRGEQWALEEGI